MGYRVSTMETTTKTQDGGYSGELGRQKRCVTTSAVVLEKQEDKCGCIGWGNLTVSHSEERKMRL